MLLHRNNFNKITLFLFVIGHWECIRINIEDKAGKKLACKSINESIKYREDYVRISQIQEIRLDYGYVVLMTCVKEKLISQQKYY